MDQHSQPSRRVLRIASRMKFLISHVILRELKDPRIGFITVLDVKPTEDLKEAKVYVSVFGSAADRSKAEKALLRARGFIQNEVGQNLETRNTPILRFVFDDSQEKVSRINTLIHQVSQEDRESTMAKKPSKKTSKPDPEVGKPSKKPQKQGGGAVDDEKEAVELDEDEPGDEAGGEAEESEYSAKSEEDEGEDFDSDFDEEGDEDDEEEDEDFDDEDFEEEDYAEDEEEEDDEEEEEALDEEDEDEDEEEEEEDEDEEVEEEGSYGYEDEKDADEDDDYDER